MTDRIGYAILNLTSKVVILKRIHVKKERMIVTVSIGKGNKISSITDKNAKKYDFTAIGETVRSQALAVLQHKGRVYVLHDDARQVKGCCILRMEEHFTSEEHHITDKKALMMEYCSVLPDVDAEEFEKAVSAELMELLFYTDTAALQWGENASHRRKWSITFGHIRKDGSHTCCWAFRSALRWTMFWWASAVDSCSQWQAVPEII